MKLAVILWNFSKKLCIKKGGCQRWGKFEYLLIFGGCKWAGAKLAGKLKTGAKLAGKLKAGAKLAGKLKN